MVILDQGIACLDSSTEDILSNLYPGKAASVKGAEEILPEVEPQLKKRSIELEDVEEAVQSFRVKQKPLDEERLKRLWDATKSGETDRILQILGDMLDVEYRIGIQRRRNCIYDRKFYDSVVDLLVNLGNFGSLDMS